MLPLPIRGAQGSRPTAPVAIHSTPCRDHGTAYAQGITQDGQGGDHRCTVGRSRFSPEYNDAERAGRLRDLR